MPMTPAERQRHSRARNRDAGQSALKPFTGFRVVTYRDDHGLSHTREYNIWQMMLKRCFDPTSPVYPRYGGRGITVCDRWRYSFRNFYEDMGPANGRTLERIDNDDIYRPGNCRWATYKEQARNKSNNRYLTFEGRTMLITDWAAETGIKIATLVTRLNRNGWTVERALTTKPCVQNPNSRGAERQRRCRERKALAGE